MTFPKRQNKQTKPLKVMDSSSYHRLGLGEGMVMKKKYCERCFWMMELFSILTVVVITYIYICIKIHRTVYQKRISLHINFKNKKQCYFNDFVICIIE